MPIPAQQDIHRKIVQGIWDVEIGLDSLMCQDGGECEEVAADAEELLVLATRLRKLILSRF